ncbi:hypothetical protein OG418_02860 [Streptomyces phaeochromogenes]
MSSRARQRTVVNGLERIGLSVPVPADGAFYRYFESEMQKTEDDRRR